MPRVGVVPGMFSWIDLMSSDAEKAKTFYTAVFEWGVQQVSTDQGPYTMFTVGGEPVAGLGQMSDEMVGSGMPSVWNSYIQVADLDATVARVGDLGGTVVMPPMDVLDFGRMAIISDPSGARVSLWESKGEAGDALYNEAGTLTWNDLVTRDPDAARAFYQELVGWGWDEMEMPEGTYWVIQNGGRPNGGVMRLTDDCPESTPSHWMAYIGSDDVDATAALVTDYGGTVQVPPKDISVGRFAVAADPTGAVFTIFKGGEM